MPPTRPDHSLAVPELKRIFLADGLRAALAYLNALSAQRFTSVFRFQDDRLQCVTFYDRDHPELETCEEIAVEASYCMFVRNSRCRLDVEESLDDSRLAGHPKQNVVRSYCGVPLVGEDGEVFGTVCHFDFSPGVIHPYDVDLLETLGGLLSRAGPGV